MSLSYALTVVLCFISGMLTWDTKDWISRKYTGKGSLFIRVSLMVYTAAVWTFGLWLIANRYQYGYGGHG